MARETNRRADGALRSRRSAAKPADNENPADPATGPTAAADDSPSPRTPRKRAGAASAEASAAGGPAAARPPRKRTKAASDESGKGATRPAAAGRAERVPAKEATPEQKRGTRAQAPRAEPAIAAESTAPQAAASVATAREQPAGAGLSSPESPSTGPTEARDPGAAVPASDAASVQSASPNAEAAPDRQAPAHPMDRLAAATALPEQLARNIERIEALTHRLIASLSQRGVPNPAIEAPGPELYLTAAGAMMKQLAEQPARILQHQTRFWGETLRHYAESQSQLLRGEVEPSEDDTADRRFRNPLWQENPFFAYVKKQYQINAEALARAVTDLEIEDQTDRRRIEWFTRQLIDMMAPTNFLATNPDALERAIATEGESLVKGLENLVADVEAAGGHFSVSLVDKAAFEVGKNIATTPGDVVWRAPLYELIQYRPTTEQVHELPLILFPPWINKFYILDLKPQNSLIRYLVAQGFTLFVVSWKNPGPELGETGMDDYLRVYLEAMEQVQKLTGSRQMNAVGYCIGGTALNLTLSHLARKGDDRVTSATFFTTLTDFSEQGEFITFLQDDFVGGIEDEVRRNGILAAPLMARTFSFLRANDLIWAPAIRSYMLGETPPAFDLLYWNSDATNLPGRMAMDYLRGLCQSNDFTDGEGFDVLGEKARIEDVKLPICSVACEGDHIAPWLDCWRGFAMSGSEDRTFILSQSGHIAGIINPPGRIKYGHYTSDAGFAGTAEDWRKAAAFHEGSWWPTWLEWLKPRAGTMVPARVPAASLGEAPGTYVHQSAADAAG